MVDIIESAVSVLEPVPYKIQMAVDRHWENAWKIDISRFEYSEDEINGFLQQNPTVVAAELFYKTRDGDDVYLGIQYDRHLKNASTPGDFLRRYLSALKNLRDRSFPSVIAVLGESLNNDASTFCSVPPASVVMGVVDWWMTFGPCKIWNRRESEVTEPYVRNRLSTRPKIISNEKNYAGLEFEFDSVTTHWLSFQVSDKKDGVYILNMSKVLALLKEGLRT